MGAADFPPRFLADSPAGVTFAVRVIPRAGRTAITGVRGDALLVRLAAPPVDGAANDALIAFLARQFDRPKRDVAIVAGPASRDKRVAIRGLTAEAAGRRLSDILSEL
jgi:uncharacterized protein (TIGR00251 family)